MLFATLLALVSAVSGAIISLDARAGVQKASNALAIQSAVDQGLCVGYDSSLVDGTLVSV